MVTEGKRYSKSEILNEINTERDKLEIILSQFSDEQLVKVGVVGEWSIKDIISHITAWEQRFITWKDVVIRGEEPVDYPASWEDVHAFNAESYSVDRNKPLSVTKKEFAASFPKAVKAVESIPAEMLEDLEYFESRKEPFWVMVAANTFWHYREHQEDFKKALEVFRAIMTLELIKLEVGPWSMNCYLLIDLATRECAIIDPGADAEKILDKVGENQVKNILITHGHRDHIGALKEVGKRTGGHVCAHPEEATRFNFDIDIELFGGYEVNIGSDEVRIHHVPGHTAGQLCFDLQDGRILVGDTLFVGGPGKTWSAEDFETTMSNMQNVVFKWPNETKFFPGHGPDGIIRNEKPVYEKFVQAGWKKGLFGDVAWE